MTPDSFTRARFEWLDQVGADHGCQGALAFRVAYSIARHLNRATGEAFPGQDRIARECGISVSGARKGIRRLIENGHLAVTHGNGRTFSNRYRPILKDSSERCHAEDTLNDQKVPPAGQDNEAKGGTVVSLFADKVSPAGQKGVPRVTTNSLKNSEVSISRNLTDTHPQEPPSSKVTDADRHFDEFWNVYPKRTDKAVAKRMFARALKKADATTIIDGARRYALERAGKDAQFTKYPGTWLNNQCWENSPIGNAMGSAPTAYADSSDWQRPKFVSVIERAKEHDSWFYAYGDPANIPRDLIEADARLQAIVARGPKPISQVVA